MDPGMVACFCWLVDFGINCHGFVNLAKDAYGSGSYFLFKVCNGNV